jgi:hypothetical protein
LLWNEVYEAVLAWYIFRPTLVALINPKLGSFNVTAKGGLIKQEYFDTTIAKASLVLLALNFVGVCLGLWRLTWVDPQNIATVWLNLAWTIYNLMILGACVAAANESRQLRGAHRVELSPAGHAVLRRRPLAALQHLRLLQRRPGRGTAAGHEARPGNPGRGGAVPQRPGVALRLHRALQQPASAWA